MKNRLTLIILLSCVLYLQAPILYAQNSEKEAVMSTVHQLFLAMETNDSTLASSLFTKGAQLYTVMSNDQSVPQLRNTSASKLAAAFGSEKTETWREPIWNEKVEIADGLASVWVDYAFYIGKNFSHCGVDAFHLIKMGNKWKIFHLADTRRKINCEIPNYISREFEK